MDVIFNCPKCDQELAVDSSGSGSQIDCPSCGEPIVIPELASTPATPAVPAGHASGGGHGSAMATSAAAKVEMHLKVPSNKTVESLIGRPLVPLEAAAKETEKNIRVKTIRHTDCVEVGHDKFDEIVTNFLRKIGESSIISVTTLTYTILDIGTQKLMTDFGVMIIYRG